MPLAINLIRKLVSSPTLSVMLAFALAGLFPSRAFVASHNYARPGAQRAEESSLRAALDSAGHGVVAAIENRDQARLLQFLSADGLAVGIDAEPTDAKIIRKQFRERRLSYCFFFDTVCYRRESAEARKSVGSKSAGGRELSLRDELKQHPRKELFVSSIRRDGQSWYGGVSVVLEPEPPGAPLIASNVIDLGFKYELGGWKLCDLNFKGT